MGTLVVLAVTLLFEIIGIVYWICLAAPNVWLYQWLLVIQTILWGYIYRQLFQERKMPTIITCLCVVSVLVEVVVCMRSDYSFSVVMAIESLFLIACSSAYFFELLQHPLEGDILYFSLFWLNIAVMFFYMVNILLWGIAVVSMPRPFIFNGIRLWNYSSYIFYIIIAFSCMLNKKSVRLRK
ncbi:MAG: hypothetical protein J7621_14050 [Niastella sp.]|nr:hypothetical protein [Niastella sp.]